MAVFDVSVVMCCLWFARTFPVLVKMVGSAANAATARPVKNGVSMGELKGMPVCRKQSQSGAQQRWVILPRLSLTKRLDHETQKGGGSSSEA